MKNKLNILWTNADPHTSKQMVMMYAKNSMKLGWWDEVTVIIWGATAKFLAQDETIQEEYRQCRYYGVEFSACESCANNFGVKDDLLELGIEVKYWGEPLTEVIKSKEYMITV